MNGTVLYSASQYSNCVCYCVALSAYTFLSYTLLEPSGSQAFSLSDQAYDQHVAVHAGR